MTVGRQTADQLVERLNKEGAVPAITEVHGQGFDFYPEHWSKRWRNEKPATSLQILSPDNSDEKGRAYVSRSSLFDLAEKVDSEETALNFFVAVYSWGVGSKARGVARGSRVIAEPDAAQRLYEGLSLFKENNFDPKVGYEQFYFKANSRIKFLGPAFFTKLLYFYGHEGTSGRDRAPVILDQRVARAIGWPARSWWTPDEYSDYIDLVDEVRTSVDPVIASDAIEYALFHLGKN